MTNKSVIIRIDGRLFTVDFDSEGFAIRIKERKIYARGEIYQCFYNSLYWRSKPNEVCSQTVSKIISLAKDKLK